MNTTEQTSHYYNLEHLSTEKLVDSFLSEEQTVVEAIKKQSLHIEKLIDLAYIQLSSGGRIFYIGAGTSGRLGVLDASELPPTFGTDPNWVIGIIAGGDKALKSAVEHAEDDIEIGWQKLLELKVSSKDIVIGISASGKTPFVVETLRKAQQSNVPTACITNNNQTPLASVSDISIEIITGPEVVTGSTRLKAGTSQKIVLNALSSSVMIRMGRTKQNKMYYMQTVNNKLKKRASEMLCEELNISYEEAFLLIEQHKSVALAVKAYRTDI